ncbi:hypothetical protein LLG90_11500 [Aromatoleum toluclasticum]|uniref:hypothetical protein n=1 Tax=Aromatoleum toluclasticum TaxID=92003 RepID=UPI001D18147E|nr:hypothetical protein [Aromatoleum toluclasticum]MCC4115974.1 hypothetical protein [Aromatoleum toluclasticum]
MDRRNFLKGMVGSGALGVAPLVAAANAGEFGGMGRPVTVIAQSEAPEAMAIAGGVAADFGVRPVAASVLQLGSYAGVTALLERAGQGRVIGVMDDASALIFQQIAAARGAGLAMDTHRRVGTASLVSFAINT